MFISFYIDHDAVPILRSTAHGCFSGECQQSWQHSTAPPSLVCVIIQLLLKYQTAISLE